MRICEGTSKLGVFIKNQREAKGISQTDLSLKCSVSVSYIHRLEYGARSKPSAVILFRIAKALDVTLDDLIKQMFDEEEE